MTFFVCFMIFIVVVGLGGWWIANSADNAAHERRMECFETAKSVEERRSCLGLFKHKHEVNLHHIHVDED